MKTVTGREIDETVDLVYEEDGKKYVLFAEDRQRASVFSRVMGYHREVEKFNPAKRSEFFERKYFTTNGGPTGHKINDKTYPCWSDTGKNGKDK